MNKIYHIILLAGALIVSMLPMSCDDKDSPDADGKGICVNTSSVADVRAGGDGIVSDNTFTVLFWKDVSHLEMPSSTISWPEPYLAALAPQPVPFYVRAVFDTRYPYPDASSYLYATGYAPGGVLTASDGYRTLTASVGQAEKGRYDFLGCDVWRDVYKGSRNDPFAQDKNKLFFRHLASKLVFYADRDKKTMENKQFVRNVRITNLYMSTDGVNYTPMYTPNSFEWKVLTASDYTSSYNTVIQAAQTANGVVSIPVAGYRTAGVTSFAGDDPDFVLEKHASDRVPIYGMSIDSCYVSNKIVNGELQGTTSGHIRLKMDISADLSFDIEFPNSDSEGSTTDDFTYTHTWKNVVLDAIYEVDASGNKTDTTVNLFKPGMEYRVYIRFNRKGVNLVAIEYPWDIGGVHYVTIPG